MIETTHTVRTYMDGQMRDTNVYERMDMRPLDKVDGPAIINEAIGTNNRPGWQAELTNRGHLVLKRVVEKQAKCHR